MALPSTLHVFEIELADADRGVYESLALRVARHPSESEDFLLARVLAYCIQYAPGLAFSAGLSTPDEPAIALRDDVGRLAAWIDIGSPSADRMRLALRAADRVVIYCHRSPEPLRRELRDPRLQQEAGRLQAFTLDRDFLARWATVLSRRMRLSLSISGGHLYLDAGELQLECVPEPVGAAEP